MCESKQGCLKTSSDVGKKPDTVLVPVESSTLYEMTGQLGEASSSLFTVDPTTGQATFVGGTGEGSILAIAIDPTDHTMYGINTTIRLIGGNTSHLYSLNKSTGVASFITNITGLASNREVVTDMTITSTGGAYIVTIIPLLSSYFNIYYLDLTTGVAALYRHVTTTRNLTQASITNNSYSFYVLVTDVLLANSLYIIGSPITSKSVTLSGFPTVILYITGLVFDPTDGLYYVTAFDPLSSLAYLGNLNISTGVVIFIGQTANTASALAIDIITTLTVKIQPQAPGVKFDMGPCC